MFFGRRLSAFRAGARPHSWWSRLGGATSTPSRAGAVVSFTEARGLLQVARGDLDEAMAALPDGDGDNAMATPALLALVLRVLEARRRVDGLDLLLVQPRAT